MTPTTHTFTKNRWITIVALIGITVIGLVLRIYRLNSVPAGFFCDEASIGFNAYTILTRGTDEYGTRFPIFFHAFGNNPPGLSIYATVPFVWAFGLNNWSVRLATAVAGTLTIPAIFLLTYLLFKSKGTALAASLLLATSPWHIQFSRFAGLNIFFPLFLTGSTGLFFLAIEKRKPLILLASYVAFSLTLYTYFAAYLIMPLFILILTLTNRRKLSGMKTSWLTGMLLSVVIMLPLAGGIFNGPTLSRFTQMSPKNNIDEVKFIRGAVWTYFSHFSPSFLFTKGDIDFPGHFITRYSVRGMGELFIIQIPLLMFGLIGLRKFPRAAGVIFPLLLLYPLGSTVVPFSDGGGPLASRSSIGTIPFAILSGFGLFYLLSLLRTQWLKIFTGSLVFLTLLFSLLIYSNKYFYEYNNYSSDFWGWQYGAEQIMAYFVSHIDDYNHAYLASNFNGPEIFLKFYDPTGVCNGKCSVGEFLPTEYLPRTLYSANEQSYQKTVSERNDIVLRSTIIYPNGKPAFRIIEVRN